MSSWSDINRYPVDVTQISYENGVDLLSDFLDFTK